MKISIDKIANYRVANKEHYSDDVFSFTLEIPNLFEQRFQLFQEKYSNEETRIKEAIERERKRNGYDQIGDSESLMKLNMKHVYGADRYFTNGQRLVSLLKNDKDFELGVHKNLNIFSDYFYDNPLLGQFSLSNLRLRRYRVFEKAELEIMRILSKIETIRIPIEHDSDRDFLEIREVYPSTYYFTLNNRTVVRSTEYNGDWIDKVTDEVIGSYKPLQIKCCKNCKHFKFSGMSYDMSGGFTGYCFLVRRKLEEIEVPESTTGIWNWCSKFEKK